MPASGAFIFIIKEPDVGVRLDTFIADHVPDCSRSFAAKLIQDGHVSVCAGPKKPSYRVQPKDQIRITVPPPVAIDIDPEPIALDILFEDEDIILINKPAGMVVHPAHGHASGTLVNALLHHCSGLKGIGGEIRPGIVHRLDKDTTGVMVAAKNESAHHALSALFKDRLIRKKYFALVHGDMPSESGQIDLPIGRHPTYRKKMSTTSRYPREALTRWRVQRYYPLCKVSFLSLQLKTGRTHQIRVHCKAIGYPLIGDPLYGSRKMDAQILKTLQIGQPMKRQLLHACQLQFTHPRSGEPLTVEAPLPQDMEDIIQFLEAIS
jgi:23S rRNA pseudouridine1911/1915/1917 synthase